MKTVLQLLNLRKTKGDYGIEIEAEGNGLKIVDNEVWRSEDDGSLRPINGFPEFKCEYILRNPIPYNAVKDALDNLAYELRNAKFNFSFRTSVHVHCNVQEFTYVQLLNLIYTYVLIEEPLANFCGNVRKGNQFALRVADADGVVYTLSLMFRKGEKGIYLIPGDRVRYAMLNLCALQKYGSVEFRGMRGTMDVEVLSIWVKAIDNIKKYSLEKASPMEIFKEFTDIGPIAFLYRVLKEDASIFEYNKAEQDMKQSFSITLDLPHQYSHYEFDVNNGVEEKEFNLGDTVTHKQALEIIKKWPMAQFQAITRELPGEAMKYKLKSFGNYAQGVLIR